MPSTRSWAKCLIRIIALLLIPFVIGLCFVNGSNIRLVIRIRTLPPPVLGFAPSAISSILTIPKSIVLISLPFILSITTKMNLPPSLAIAALLFSVIWLLFALCLLSEHTKN